MKTQIDYNMRWFIKALLITIFVSIAVLSSAEPSPSLCKAKRLSVVNCPNEAIKHGLCKQHNVIVFKFQLPRTRQNIHFKF